MDSWSRVYAYFLELGFPKELLDFVCIRHEEAAKIGSIIQKKQPRAILEIGTFIGLSTGVLALISPPHCMVVGVDPNFPVSLLLQRVHQDERQPAFSFLKSMLQHFDISHKVMLLEGGFSYISSSYRDRYVAQGGDPRLIDSKEVKIIGPKAEAFAPYDLVFLDGDHSAEAVYYDLFLIQKYLAEDGIIVLHDAADENYWGQYVLAGVMRFRDDFPEFKFDRSDNLGLLIKQPQAEYINPFEEN